MQHQIIDINTNERVLGVLWNVLNDIFGFNITLPDKPVTRSILSTLSRLYDSLGFAAPVVVLKPKLLLQSLCKAGLTLDEKLAPEQITEWQTWLDSLVYLNNVYVQKCHKPAEFGPIAIYEIHHFADFFAEGYETCTYLRLTNEQSSIHCCFFIGKCQLSPSKTLSIPKLELSAAVLAVRLDIMIWKELALNNCSSTFWSDSTAVLQMIRNSNKQFPVFVANRISVIETHTNIDDWMYVPIKQNQADLASYGCAAKTLVQSKLWYLCPEFLWKTEDRWPQGTTPQTLLPEFD